MDVTADVLFGKTRQAILALLFEQPEQTYYLRELSRLTGISPGALQHELGRLQKADLIQRVKDGNRVTYKPNTAHPIFTELQSLISKTCGVPAQLKAALSPHAAQIAFAVIYGSLAKGTSHALSDVDLLVVGTLRLDQAIAAIVPVEKRIGREISVRTLLPMEFRERRARGDNFIASVMAGQLVPVLGQPDDA